MSEYTLSTGETFQTMILPKGTLLFHGMDTHTNKPHPEYIFTDLFGYQDADGYYCVDPHESRFFYPAPFVSDSVARYAIHAIYHTNYDLELLMMVKPSTNTQDKSLKTYVRCNELSEKDQCGKPRHEFDPCLSPQLLQEYPHIQGFIGIVQKDANIFMKGQLYSFFQNIPESIDFIRPFVISDDRGIQGIPEIALFPFHARHETILEKHVLHPRAVPHQIQYAIANRSKLNVFPMVYVTEKGFYSFPELLDAKKLEELSKSERENINFDSAITYNMLKLMKAALDAKGFFIGNVSYKCTIDVRTGFYVLDLPDIRRLNYTTKRINIMKPDHSDPMIVPFHFPVELKKKIHSSLHKHTTEEALETSLNRLYSSYSKYYIFNRGNPTIQKRLYKLDLVLPRPELDIPRKKYTMKKRKKQKG
jgi:hypothetical protein